MTKFTTAGILIIAVLTFPVNIIPQSRYTKPFNIENHGFISGTLNSPPIIQNKVSSNIFLIDSILTTSITGGKSKHILSYNSNYDLTEWLNLVEGENEWINSYKTEYFYDSEDNLIHELDLSWNSNAWDSLVQINFTYSGGNIYQQIIESYTSNGWTNYSRTTYNYYSSGYISNTISEEWINNNWQTSQQTKYSYNQVNKTDSILFLTWNGSQWQNYFKTRYFYSTDLSEEDSIIAQSWTGAKWLNSTKRIPTFDLNHNRVEYIDQNWEINNWVNSNRFEYTFNGYSYITSADCEIWNNNQWEYGDGIIIFENPDGIIAGFYTNELYAYYSEITETRDEHNLLPAKYLLYQNYPNPFNPATTIKYSIPEMSAVTIKVYNILGKEIAVLVDEEEPAGTYNVSFNASKIASGVYYYTISAGNFNAAKKMILMK
jgi:Secretion system C-terminal sorting domain